MVILLLPIYTRELNTDEFGMFEILSTIYILFNLLGALQIESAVGRHLPEAKSFSEKQRIVSTAFWTISLCSPVFCVVGILLSVKTVEYWPYRISFKAILYLFLSVPLFSIFNLFGLIARYENKPLRFFSITLVHVLASIGFAIFFVKGADLGIEGIFLAQLIAAGIGFSIYLIMNRKTLILNVDHSKLKELLAYGIPLMPAVIGAWASTHVSRVYLTLQFSLHEVALLGVAAKITGVVKLIEYAFRMAWGPFVVQNYENHSFPLLARNVLSAVFVVSVSISVSLSFYSEHVLLLLSSIEYTEAHTLIQYLVIAQGLLLVNQVVSIGPTLKKKTKYLSYSFGYGFIAQLTLLVTLCPLIGLRGAAIAFLGGVTVVVGANFYISEKMYTVGHSKYKLIGFFIVSLVAVHLTEWIKCF